MEFEEITKPEVRSSKMSQSPSNPNNLIDTTDCLEAVSVFRGWKNGFFVIILFLLLLLQTAFWLVDTGLVKADESTQNDTAAVKLEEQKPVNVTVHKAPADANDSELIVMKTDKAGKISFPVSLTFEQLSWFVKVSNFILIPIAVLYCLTMLFGLKVSLLGRLGGINHIARAFFLSLIMLVFLLPWQNYFGGIVIGVIYSPEELLNAGKKLTDGGIVLQIPHYLRFTGLWLLVMLLLIFAQVRSARWANAMLRRLEII